MELSQEQKTTIAQWIADGAQVGDVQKRLASEMNINMTYMDVRFLIDDLNLELADTRAAEADAEAKDALVEDAELTPEGSVSVESDVVTTPGALISGSVTFSDGVSAKWMIDQMGRPSLQADDPNYRPSQEDLEAFQSQLMGELQKKGMM